MIAMITAETRAAAAPCRRRATTRTPPLGERPHSIEATTKERTPSRKTRLRPKRSPRRPARRSRLPKVIR
jgi:hypothetical protein